MANKHVGEDEICLDCGCHQSNVMLELKSMCESRELTDVCIIVDDRQFFCHRGVLAATSCYFRAMFTSGLGESRQSDVRLHEVDAESVGALISYAYTGHIQITRHNVQNLMVTASLFQVNQPFYSIHCCAQPISVCNHISHIK